MTIFMMKKSSSCRICRTLTFVALGIAILVPNPALAQTKYVSGLLSIGLRETGERNAKILATIKTGDQVEILEEKNHYLAKIRTKDNIEGWVPTMYLRDDPPTLATIARLKDEIEILKSKNGNLTVNAGPNTESPQVGSSDQTVELLKKQNKQLTEENQKLIKAIQEKQLPSMSDASKETASLREKATLLQTQLDTLTENSKSVIEITSERDSLRAQVTTLQADLTKVQDMYNRLIINKTLRWFFAGAIVFFLGLLSSKLSLRKKSKLSF